MNNQDIYTFINVCKEAREVSIAKSSTAVLNGTGEISLTIESGINVEIIDLSEGGITLNIVIGKDAAVKMVSVIDSAAINNYTIDYANEGGEFKLYGITISKGDDKIEFYTTVNHNESNGYSEQFIKSIATGSSSTKFEGKINIVEGVKEIEAYQQNKNLLLTKTARIESHPWLEIYADDVKCSHGSTTGMLNPDEIFYMRQRGLSEDGARKLQIEGFVYDILNNISSDELRDKVADRVTKTIDSL